MDEDEVREEQSLALQVATARAMLLLAKTAAVYDAALESERLQREGDNVPADELVHGPPDLDEVLDKEADMTVAQAAGIVANFFDMGVEGRGKLMAILGLEPEDVA